MTRSSRRVCRTALCCCGRPENLAEPRTFGKNFSKESSAPLCAPNGFRRRGRHSTDRALGCQGKGRKSFRAVTKGGTCEGQHAGREDAQDMEVTTVYGSCEGKRGARESGEPAARRLATTRSGRGMRAALDSPRVLDGFSGRKSGPRLRLRPAVALPERLQRASALAQVQRRRATRWVGERDSR
jgi:hypothetical protein